MQTSIVNIKNLSLQTVKQKKLLSEWNRRGRNQEQGESNGMGNLQLLQLVRAASSAAHAASPGYHPPSHRCRAVRCP